MVSLYFGFQTRVRQESSVIRHLLFHQRLPTLPHPLPTHYEIRCIQNQEYFLEKNSSVVRDGPRSSNCATDEIFQGNFLTPPTPKFLEEFPRKKRPHQRICCQLGKTTFYGGQPRSWSAEQKSERRTKQKSLAAHPAPPLPTLLVRRNR